MVDINSISFQDDKTWRLIQSGNTAGVFQLESELGQQWSSRIKPKNINELSALIALIRPACLESGMTETYSRIKSGSEDMKTFGDVDVDRILLPTLGVLVYQEQLMKFGSEIAWKHIPYLERLVMVDKLRKGVGKKDYKIIGQLKDLFIDGFVTNNKPRQLGEQLFSIVESAGRYAFNDAHAKKYAIWSYRTAYLKANHPLDFYCVYMTYSKAKQKPKEELRGLINEAKMRGFSVFPPSIKDSYPDFKVSNTDIVFGLSHIKQVGIKDSLLIVNNRPLTFYAFLVLTFDKTGECLRFPGTESLIKSGACDCYGLSRTVMLDIVRCISELTPREIVFVLENIKGKDSIDEVILAILDCADKVSTKKRAILVKSEASSIKTDSIDANEWKALNESELLGLSMTCTSVDSYMDITESCCRDCFKINKNNNKIKKRVIAAITSSNILITKKGNNPGQEMCQIGICDSSGEIRVVCFPDTYAKNKHKIFQGAKCEFFLRGTGSGWSVESITVVP